MDQGISTDHHFSFPLTGGFFIVAKPGLSGHFLLKTGGDSGFKPICDQTNVNKE
jgi:hypothetical protein